mmetsp:Transcript_15448/g.48625  ORF Transcript_15448/g.48625 Transcript_15448/m.48625 type:complete len:270 (-) Transcript_15448:300-1109(-)
MWCTLRFFMRSKAPSKTSGSKPSTSTFIAHTSWSTTSLTRSPVTWILVKLVMRELSMLMPSTPALPQLPWSGTTTVRMARALAATRLRIWILSVTSLSHVAYRKYSLKSGTGSHATTWHPMSAAMTLYHPKVAPTSMAISPDLQHALRDGYQSRDTSRSTAPLAWICKLTSVSCAGSVYGNSIRGNVVERATRSSALRSCILQTALYAREAFGGQILSVRSSGSLGAPSIDDSKCRKAPSMTSWSGLRYMSPPQHSTACFTGSESVAPV